MGWIVFIVIVLIAIFFVSIYNKLVGGRNAYKNAFAQIDVQLTRRHEDRKSTRLNSSPRTGTRMPSSA